MKLKIPSIKSLFKRYFLSFGAISVLVTLMSACQMVNEDLEECPKGLSVRFIYDYNMERANAFHAQVDCVTLYIFDQTGHLVQKISEDSEVLKDETYRMTLDIEPGNYSLMAIGGSTCEKNSFDIEEINTRDHISTFTIRLPLDDSRNSNVNLHDLFYGDLKDVEVKPYEMKEVNLYLVKDTNSVQISLQEIDAPYRVDASDYEFYIEADNELLDSNNMTISTGGMGYNPYDVGNRVAGFVDVSGSNITVDESMKVQIAVSEFHVSRLMTNDTRRSFIVVRSKDSGKEIIRIPLIEYMILSRHNGHNWITSDQEYLDRQNTWNFMFFLKNGKWIKSQISINNWIIRFNNADV